VVYGVEYRRRGSIATTMIETEFEIYCREPNRADDIDAFVAWLTPDMPRNGEGCEEIAEMMLADLSAAPVCRLGQSLDEYSR
jgi:hypothetical protein